MTWGDNESYYDELEWANIDWLKGNLPSYLQFHADSLGHLPANFVYTAGRSPFARDTFPPCICGGQGVHWSRRVRQCTALWFLLEKIKSLQRQPANS